MHESTMEYLKPSTGQVEIMAETREVFSAALVKLEELIPDGRYKDLAIDALEVAAMWANKGITRESDGTPRPGAT